MTYQRRIKETTKIVETEVIYEICDNCSKEREAIEFLDFNKRYNGWFRVKTDSIWAHFCSKECMTSFDYSLDAIKKELK